MNLLHAWDIIRRADAAALRILKDLEDRKDAGLQ